jgi:hypothetical protein
MSKSGCSWHIGHGGWMRHLYSHRHWTVIVHPFNDSWPRSRRWWWSHRIISPWCRAPLDVGYFFRLGSHL